MKKMLKTSLVSVVGLLGVIWDKKAPLLQGRKQQNTDEGEKADNPKKKSKANK